MDLPLAENARALWAALDLPALQARMDTDAALIQTAQGDSLHSRKDLALKTKTFKALDDPTKLDSLNPLLKCYQGEIDALYKRAKLVEGAFFKAYRAIAEAPDPAPLLAAQASNASAAARVTELEHANEELQQKLLAYADYDALKSRIDQMSRDAESAVQKTKRQVASEWESVLQEKEMAWEKEKSALEANAETMRAKLEESALTEKMLVRKLQNNDIEFERDSLDAEANPAAELLEKEVADLKANAHTLQRRNEALRADLAQATAKSETEIQAYKQSQRDEYANLESEVALLSAKLNHERTINADTQRQLSEAQAAASASATALAQQAAALSAAKDATHDYEETKRELEVLRQIQFGDETPESTEIESAILQRNRKLNNDVVELRNKADSLEAQLTQSTETIQSLTSQLESLKSGNAALERQLENLDAPATDRWETMSMISSIAPAQRVGPVSPAASIAGALESSATPAGDSSLLPIITQQRDRFRNRNRDLEDENKRNLSKLMELKREVNTLKSDNKELYEKIQFLKFHSQGTSEGAAGSLSNVDRRYQDDYERQLHPIERFRIMETNRISSKISPWERVFIQVTKTVLSTQYTRWLFVGYCATLHLLVALLSLHLVSSAPVPIVSHAALNSATGGKAV